MPLDVLITKVKDKSKLPTAYSKGKTKAKIQNVDRLKHWDLENAKEFEHAERVSDSNPSMPTSLPTGEGQQIA